MDDMMREFEGFIKEQDAPITTKQLMLNTARTYAMLYKTTSQRSYLDAAKHTIAHYKRLYCEETQIWEIKLVA